MNRKAYGYFGCLLLFLVTLFSTQVNAEQSSLLAIAQDLHCVQSEKQAENLLAKLSALPLKPFGIPSENLTNGQNAELHAATVDILLQVLYETIQRYPKLREQAERTALLWNYCEIINDGNLADLIARKNEIKKSEAIGLFPVKKKGFRAWGFLGKNANTRYVPEMLNSPSLYPRMYQDLIQRLTQKQCFPHPELDTSQDDSSASPYSGALHVRPELGQGKKYPYYWQQQCKPTYIQNNPPKSTKKTIVKFAQKQNIKPVNPLGQTVAVTEPKQPPKAAQKQKPKRPPKKIVVADNSKKTILGLDVKQYTQPTADESPVISPAIPSGNSNMGGTLPLPPTGGLGIAGNFYHRAKLTGALSFGVNASWKPISYFFIRGGVNYNYLPDSGKFSYSWGLGYDDWHPGTFSAQLNNWGPIAPGDDPLKGAVANFGYKFEAEFLKPYHLTGSAAINVPLWGDPSISTTWIWSPIDHWFIRGSLSKSMVSAGGVDWSYSFGYSDWHPFTFSLTYDNWGTNPIFDSSQGNSFNFSENGAISLSWSWAF
jgi:hypothetical protein